MRLKFLLATSLIVLLSNIAYAGHTDSEDESEDSTPHRTLKSKGIEEESDDAEEPTPLYIHFRSFPGDVQFQILRHFSLEELQAFTLVSRWTHAMSLDYFKSRVNSFRPRELQDSDIGIPEQDLFFGNICHIPLLSISRFEYFHREGRDEMQNTDNSEEVKVFFAQHLVRSSHLKRPHVYAYADPVAQKAGKIEQLSIRTSILGIINGRPVENDTCLFNVPAMIGQFNNLSVFRVDGFKLVTLPKDLAKLPVLRELALNRCELTDLPEVIPTLTLLESLDLGYNRIKELPDLKSMSNVRRLNLQNNPLTRAPMGLSQVRYMCLVDTSLGRLPKGFYRNFDQTGFCVLDLGDRVSSSYANMPQAYKDEFYAYHPIAFITSAEAEPDNVRIHNQNQSAGTRTEVKIIKDEELVFGVSGHTESSEDSDDEPYDDSIVSFLRRKEVL